MYKCAFAQRRESVSLLVSVCLRAKGAEVLLPPERVGKKMPCEIPGQHPAALSHVSLRKKSLVHVPDFRQQRWELLVLEAEGENLLWVDTAECAQAHQLHQHAGKHQVILRRHLIQSFNRPLLRPHVCRHGDSGVPLTCRPLQQGVNCYLHLVFLSWCKSAGGRHTAAGVAPPDRDPARWVDLSKQTWLSSYLSDCRITFQTPL